MGPQVKRMEDSLNLIHGGGIFSLISSPLFMAKALQDALFALTPPSGQVGGVKGLFAQQGSDLDWL
jgi:hypothetical protein